MKNLSIVLVSALCLVLTACGGEESDQNTGNNEVRTQVQSSNVRDQNCGMTYNAGYSHAKNGSNYRTTAEVKYYEDSKTGGSQYSDDKYILNGSSGGVQVYEHIEDGNTITCIPQKAPTPSYTPTPKPTYTPTSRPTYTAPVPAPKPTYTAPAPAPKPTYTAPAPAPKPAYQPAPAPKKY